MLNQLMLPLPLHPPSFQFTRIWQLNLANIISTIYWVKSSLFYRNIQIAQKETAKDNSAT